MIEMIKSMTNNAALLLSFVVCVLMDLCVVQRST